MERICAQLVTTVVSIVLARILVPDDYSVVGIVAIFFSFCSLFISSGINSALIQKKDSDELDYCTVFTVNMTAALMLYAVMFFSAPAISRAYEKPMLDPIIKVMGLTFFVNGYKAVICAKVSSDMQFRKFFFATLIGTVTSAVIGLAMAAGGMGPWALVAQQMTNSTIDSLFLTFTVRLRLRFRFSRSRFRRLFSYGGRIFLASCLNTIYENCRPLIVGLKFSTTDLAFYNKGQSFPGQLNELGNNTLSSTLFPAMAKVQDDRSAVLAMTRRFMRISSFLIFPLMAGLIAVSKNFVFVLLTEKWMPIVPFMTVFAICYAFDIIQVGNLQAIKAIGRSDYILRMEIIKKVSYFIVIFLFVMFSRSALILSFSTIVCTAIATAVNTFPNRKLIGYKYKYQLFDVLNNLIVSVVMGVAVYLIGGLIPSPFAALIVQVVSGVLIYIVLNIIIKNDNLRYFLDILSSFIGRGKKVK